MNARMIIVAVALGAIGCGGNETTNQGIMPPPETSASANSHESDKVPSAAEKKKE